MSKEKQVAIQAAKKAGKVLLQYFGKVKDTYKKYGTREEDIITKADLESEKIIVSIIKKNFPKHNIIAEEKTNINNNSKYTWYIDPLDGTWNYYRKIEQFGISIGLTKNSEPTLGVCYLPKQNKLFHAEKSKRVFLNNKRIRVSDTNDLSKSICVISGWFFERPKGTQEMLELVYTKVANFRSYGSATFQLMELAQGKVDFYTSSGCRPWDFAAGICILKEAGGKATDFRGNEWDAKSNSIIASNKKLHSKILNIIK